MLPRQEGLKGPGIEIREAACAGERQIRSGEVWRALGGSRGRGCQWDLVFSAQGCVDCCFLTASVLCGSPVPPPKSLMSVWRSRARPAKDTTHFLCPGDGLWMEMRWLLPGHRLLLEMMSPLISSAWGVLVSPWHPCVVSFGIACPCSHGLYWPAGPHSPVAVLGGRGSSQQLLVGLFQTLLATEDVLSFLFHRETTHSWKTPTDRRRLFPDQVLWGSSAPRFTPVSCPHFLYPPPTIYCVRTWLQRRPLQLWVMSCSVPSNYLIFIC